VTKRSSEEQAGIGLRYQEIILTEAGVSAPRELILKIMKKTQQLFKGMTFVLFDDVLATLKTLKEQKFILGLLTNATKDMVSVHRTLGLEPYLDFIVTSEEVGAGKPRPPMFLAALERAKVSPSEAIYVGDQYKLDVLGARGVGITPILIDRYDLFAEINDCPRIRTLTELTEYL